MFAAPIAWAWPIWKECLGAQFSPAPAPSLDGNTGLTPHALRMMPQASESFNYDVLTSSKSFAEIQMIKITRNLFSQFESARWRYGKKQFAGLGITELRELCQTARREQQIKAAGGGSQPDR